MSVAIIRLSLLTSTVFKKKSCTETRKVGRDVCHKKHKYTHLNPIARSKEVENTLYTRICFL